MNGDLAASMSAILALGHAHAGGADSAGCANLAGLDSDESLSHRSVPDPTLVSTATALGRVSLLASLIWLSTTCGTFDKATPGRLEIEELRALPLPGGFDVKGGALSRTGWLLLWSPRRTDLLMIGPSGKQQTIDVASNEAPIAAAFVQNDSEIEVLFGPSERIVRLSLGGVVLAERLLGQWSDSVSIHSAVNTARGWLTSAQDRSGNLVLLQESGTKDRRG